jgi:hypothetical protein
MKKDKIMHIITCFILTLLFSLIVKYWWLAPPIVFMCFTYFKEYLLDKGILRDFMIKYLGTDIKYRGCFDIYDIGANAIGCIIAFIVLLIYNIIK